MSGTLGDLGQLGDGSMQMGFGGGASDPYMMELMRRRAMADALAKQGMAEAARPMTHWLQPLGSIVQQGVAAWRQGKADDELLNYAKGQAVADQEARRNIMAMLLGGGQGATPTPAPQPQPVAPSQGSGGAPLPIAATTLAPEAKALLTGISGAESPGYNVRYGGSTFDGYADHPRTDVPIMTGPMRGQTSSAAGRYQFLGSTWDNVKAKYGLPDFSPASQDLGAWQLARDTYQTKTGRDLAADMKSQDPQVRMGITNALAGVWPSLPGGNQPNGATNGFWQRVDAAMGGAQPTVNVSTATTSPPPSAPPVAAPTAAGGPLMLDKNRMLAAALAAGLSGRPGLAPLGTMLAGVARALPETWTPDTINGVRVQRSSAGKIEAIPQPEVGWHDETRNGIPGQSNSRGEWKPYDPTLTRVTLNNNNPGEDTYANDRGKALSARVTEWEDAWNKGNQVVARINQFERLNKEFATGIGSGAKITVGQIAQRLGVPDTFLSGLGLDRNQVASGETMNMISNRMMMDMMGPGGFPTQNFSNADAERLARTTQNIQNSEQGNILIGQVARAAAQRNIEIGKAWREWKAKNGDTRKSADQFQSERLPQIVERDIIAKVNSPDEARKLAPGTLIELPDGTVGVVPRAGG